MNGLPWLSVMTFLPLLSAAVLMFVPKRLAFFARVMALGSTILTFAVGAGLWCAFDRQAGGLQFGEVHPWIPSLGVEYKLGVDGLGILMVLLATLIVPFSIVSARHTAAEPAYFSLLLALQTGLIGTFTAQNFFHWFIFWEAALIPAYFLIKLWGGERSSRAAMLFFIYTMVGSVAMLLSFLALFWASHTFDFQELARMAHSGELMEAMGSSFHHLGTHSGEKILFLIFCGVLLGFAVKVPMFPFHVWAPITYSEAPTSTTMLLTGVMSKMGVYGFLRILLPIFPTQMQVALTPLLWSTVFTIVLSAFSAFAQTDIRKMMAYSSINHLGYCLLGILAAAKFTGGEPMLMNEKAAALDGVLLQMFNHGVTAALIFCFIGLLESRSGGLRTLDSFGGLRKVMPIFCGLMGIALFASLGLPGLNGFVGEFLIFKGAFPLVTWATALSVIGLLVTAIFLLTLIQRVFAGPLNERWITMPDLSWRERFIVLPAIALIFVTGLAPMILTEHFNATVVALLNSIKP